MNYSTLKYPSNISNRCTINQKPPTSRASIGHVSKQIVPRVAVPFTGIDVTESNRGPGKRVHRRPLGSSIRKTRSLGRIWLRHAPIQANGHTDVSKSGSSWCRLRSRRKMSKLEIRERFAVLPRWNDFSDHFFTNGIALTKESFSIDLSA